MSAARASAASRIQPDRPLWAWLAVGVLGYLALPWYAIQDANGLTRVGQVFGDAASANGLAQIFAHGRLWLLTGLLGLGLAAVGIVQGPGRSAALNILYPTPAVRD